MGNVKVTPPPGQTHTELRWDQPSDSLKSGKARNQNFYSLLLIKSTREPLPGSCNIIWKPRLFSPLQPPTILQEWYLVIFTEANFTKEVLIDI